MPGWPTALADVPSQRWPELTLTAPLGKWLLLAKMDLVAIAPDGRALLLDWKTGRHMPRAARQAQRLQTRVYRYVLAQAGARLNGGEAIDLARIEMRYWYAQHEGEVLRFPYDEDQHRADGRFLRGLAREIDRREDFPPHRRRAALPFLRLPLALRPRRKARPPGGVGGR